MRTLCAICTRLSIFVPAPITVSSMLPRSIVVFAPISTSDSDDAAADVRDLGVLAVAEHVPEAVDPRRAPECTRTRSPNAVPE